MIKKKLAILALLLGLSTVTTPRADAIVYWGIGGGYALNDLGTGTNDHSYPVALKLGLKSADVFFEIMPMWYNGYRGADIAIAYLGVFGVQLLQFVYLKSFVGGFWTKADVTGNKDNKLMFGGGGGLRAPGPGMAIFLEGNFAVIEKTGHNKQWLFLAGMEYAF